jgi:general secretion pathway protein G
MAARPTAVRSRGFTALETIILLIAVGMIASFFVPQLLSAWRKPDTKVARAQLETLEKALDQYRLDMGGYPTTELGLEALLKRPEGDARWRGPYLKTEKAIPKDPWGRPFVYRSPGDHGEFDLLSLGRDGQPGGLDEDADISIER